jgi:hypothetical protein
VIYQIKNLRNGKVYIGKHQTTDVDDGYFGSGKLLHRAIKKYGLNAFEKTILHVFATEAEMVLREVELVTEEFCARGDTYNLCPGGHGGWGYVNHNWLNNSEAQKEASRRTLAKIDHSAAGRLCVKSPKYWETMRPRWEIGIFRGHKHRSKTRRKMRASHKGKHDGPRNSQYGTCWITDGASNRKLKRGEVIPTGWELGRSC